jgi:hypothetical protein
MAVVIGAASAMTSGAAAKPAPVTGSLGPMTPLGTAGVSAHAVALPDGSAQLYYSSMDGGTAVDSCTAQGACSRQTVLRGVNDFTVVTLQDGTRRGYFLQMDPTTQSKAMFTAVVASDGLSYADPIPLGIASQPGQRAWGVPDSVILPDGRVRLYWVDMPARGPRAGEVIVSATSTDASGTVFTRDPGYRTTGGLVDFEVLQARPGHWIAITSTMPARPPQALLLAVSKDGLRWQVNRRPISPSSANYLDPTGIPIDRNRFRVYFTTAPKNDPFGGFALNQAVLTVKVAG